LDKFIKLDCADPQQCALGAFVCLLKAAQCGLYLSDTNFFNFGVNMTGFATEHSVVIIDAGSRGWRPDDPRWSKKEINITIMKQFWKHCLEHGIDTSELKAMWRTGDADWIPSLQCAQEKWVEWPWLTKWECTATEVQAMCLATEQHEILQMQDTAAYSLLLLVARQEWIDTDHADFHDVCNQAYRSLNITADGADTEVLQELHSRITRDKSDDDLCRTMQFWLELATLREQFIRRTRESTPDELTPVELEDCKRAWKDYFIKTDATPKQRKQSEHKQTQSAFAVMNKKAGWKYAGWAILQLGLPKIVYQNDRDTATERVCAMATFAEAMVRWLQRFDTAVSAYRATAEYQHARQKSGTMKHTSGLTEEQSAANKARDHARYNLSWGRALHNYRKCRDAMTEWERWIFDAYQSGALEEELQNAQKHVTAITKTRFYCNQ
jgi:hypothetical protein